MCSISGVFGTGVTQEADRELVARMNAAQQHRGPDDEGVWVSEFENGHVVLGNTRLAIIDTSSAAHQPMFDPQTGNCLTYNGETYNFKDLSDFIRVNPRSRSDTEVVLHAYSEWDTDVFAKLRGMFALAIWNHEKRELVLARDRFGIKPLYYYLSNQRLIFASELRALLATGAIPRKLSRAGLESYLAYGSVAAPLTIVEGVQQLLPGHYLRVTATQSGDLSCTITKFANEQHVARPANRNEAVAQLRAELEESIRLHLVSDVPLGVFLSGGMDSSALVALMSRIGEQRPKTFSVVFDEAELSEERHARAVAETFQTEHCEIRLGEQQLIDMLPEALAALDQPTMDGINTFVVSKAVKNAGVTVALSGLGGDELFAGYPSFRRALKVAALPRVSRRVLRAAAGVGKHVLNGTVQREKFWELARSRGSAEEVYRITRGLFATAVSPQIQTNQNGKNDVINQVSRLELEGYMANTLLRDTDVMSMAHSLEVRVPFVDTKLVDYVLSLPGEWKLDQRHSGVPKPLLADAVADLLPREFLGRRKMGFTLPFEKWMQGRLRREIAAVLEDPSVSDVGLGAIEVRELWQRFLQTPRAVGWSRPWSLFVLARWCAINQVGL
ncbi:MAG TPA: asparagine synthase (glutamine-hydrolyzing) [Pyrinomonadaceae bacterium]|nr:asparagine synthase (glutamine-hydrolyzing) [Pyrinomonadaceae bacterium]